MWQPASAWRYPLAWQIQELTTRWQVFVVRGYVYLELSALLFEAVSLLALLELVIAHCGGIEALVSLVGAVHADTVTDFHAVFPFCCVPFGGYSFDADTIQWCRRRVYLLGAVIAALLIMQIILGACDSEPNDYFWAMKTVRVTALMAALHGVFIVARVIMSVLAVHHRVRVLRQAHPHPGAPRPARELHPRCQMGVR